MLVGAVLPRREPDELRAVLPVFSRVAFIAVVVLAVSGTYAAWRGIGTPRRDLQHDLRAAGRRQDRAVRRRSSRWRNLSRRLVRRRTVAYAMTDAALLEEPEAVEPDRARPRAAAPLGATSRRSSGWSCSASAAVLVAQPRGKEALAAPYREPVTATAPLGGGHS